VVFEREFWQPDEGSSQRKQPPGKPVALHKCSINAELTVFCFGQAPRIQKWRCPANGRRENEAMSEPARGMIEELYDYNDWANQRLLLLCDDLTDEVLDESREIGFGSLRATLFHILAAERVWLDRWLQRPRTPLETDPAGMTVARWGEALREVSEERAALIAVEERTGFERIVNYDDSQGTPYAHRIGDLLLHVANHGIHHRAQALHFLKQHGRTIPAGLDYLFYKLARPDVTQSEEAVAALREFGLEVASQPGREVRFDRVLIERYFAYGDWAFASVVDAAARVSDELLDRDYGMGLGTIRRNLLHIYDAEQWWLRNWTEGGRARFDRLPESTTLDDLRNRWAAVTEARSAYVQSLDEQKAAGVVEVSVGPTPPMTYRIIESLLQLCGHGTHHRAQVVNMIRRSGVTPPPIDLIVWIRR
jgi:uncharacterized damage-inducible protein DinB